MSPGNVTATQTTRPPGYYPGNAPVNADSATATQGVRPPGTAPANPGDLRPVNPSGAGPGSTFDGAGQRPPPPAGSSTPTRPGTAPSGVAGSNATQAFGTPLDTNGRTDLSRVHMDQLGQPTHGPSYTATGRPAPPSHGSRPAGAYRPYDNDHRPDGGMRPPSRSFDHRYARPSPIYVQRPVGVNYNVPARYGYRPYYTRWYVHPWYRGVYSTNVFVNVGYPCSPWSTYWNPYYRAGWGWVGGGWYGSVWSPGYWQPYNPAPIGYVYVPGWWYGTSYVDGWYRPAQRTDGAWRWIDGYYLEDGTYVRGYWEPTQAGPQGYVWEPGFWDGQQWVEGFWRPQYRSDFTWVSAYYDNDGTFHTGYWAPTQAQPGQVWIPGWFDGNAWIEGYWVDENQYQNTDVSTWQAPEGYDAGWQNEGYGSGQATPNTPSPPPQEQALGIPIDN